MRIDAVIPDSVPGSQKIIVAIGDIQANSKGRNAHFLGIIETRRLVVLKAHSGDYRLMTVDYFLERWWQWFSKELTSVCESYSLLCCV